MYVSEFGYGVLHEDLGWAKDVSSASRLLNLPKLLSQDELDAATKRRVTSGMFVRVCVWFRQASLRCLKAIAAFWCLILRLFLVFLLSSQAQAEVICMAADDLEAALIDWYGEHPSRELSSEIVLWKSNDGHTWTVVEYLSDGRACSLLSGMNWDENRELVSFANQ